jgi:hypothetical protein
MLRSDLGNLPPRLIAAVLATLTLALPSHSLAHEIPTDVIVQAFLKPEGQRLRLLVRVPLAAMRDMDVPMREQGYLDLARADATLRDAAILWIADFVELYEGKVLLRDPNIVAALVSLPSDRSFADYENAVAHVMGAPLPKDTEIYWDQGMLDVLFEYTIQSDRSDFSIRPGFEGLGLRVINVIRFLPPGDPPGSVVRAFEFVGDPGLVRMDPRWHQAALKFVELGFFHILDGADHLLFLFCLIIPFRRFRPLVVIVTSFTVAHSITLIASALGFAPQSLWFPPLVETLIAMSIIYMAFENIVGAKLRRRWVITFGFGLIHGFGFSFALRETLQFAGSHLLTSLLAFNLGVEMGQLLALLLLIPMLEVFFRFGVAERVGTIFLSALVIHTAWHWMIERAADLRQFSWPEVDAALLASAMRWLMLVLILSGLVWLVSLLRPRAAPIGDNETPIGAGKQRVKSSLP